MNADDIKCRIRAIYSELIGYLSQCPIPQYPSDIFANNSPWKQYNTAILELKTITDEDYDRFVIKPEYLNSEEIVHILTYRQALGGLIRRIHGTHFSDEDEPFSPTPRTVVSQSQYQTQSVQMLLDFQSKIDQELQNVPGDQKKEGFLKKCKEQLSHVKDVNDLVKLMITTAKQFGLNLADPISLFG